MGLFDAIFGSRKKEPVQVQIPHVPLKRRNVGGYYEMNCPYCLESFDAWEMPFRAYSDAAVGQSKRTAGRAAGGRRGGYGQAAVEETAAPSDSGAELNSFPLEQDALFDRFMTRMNIKKSGGAYLGKVLYVFHPKDENGNDGAFDGNGIREVQVDYGDSMEWIRLSSGMEHQLRHKAIVAVKDIYGHETSTRLCPHCHNTMPDSACKIPSYVVMLMGDTNSGKTVYKIRLLHELSRNGILNRAITLGTFYTSDTIDGIAAKSVAELYRGTFQAAYMGKGAIAPITQIEYIPPFTVTLLQNGEEKALLTFYDFPGEAIWKGKDEPEYRWFTSQIQRRMNRLDGIIFLLDTSSVDYVRAALKDEYKISQNQASNQQSGYDVRGKATPFEVLDQFRNNYLTAQMENKIEVPVCYVFSKADLLDMLIREHRDCLSEGSYDDQRYVPELDGRLDSVMDPPVCLTNWEELGLAEMMQKTHDEIYSTEGGGTYDFRQLQQMKRNFVAERQRMHTLVDMENILRSHEELEALLGDELGTITEVSPKGLLFAVSAVGAPVKADEQIQRADPVRLTEPMEYLLWQMGLIECIDPSIQADLERLAKLRSK